jgi:broad specificity phosphatase PhoE
MRLFILVRHGQSVHNLAGTVNGDPLRDLGLSEDGIEQARELGRQLAAIPLQLVAVSPFPRAGQTAEIALMGRQVERLIDPDLGDVRIGELEGASVATYRAATAHQDRGVRFPAGESLSEAARRYARAFTRLLARSEPVTLVVSHELALRYAINAASGSTDLDRPLHQVANATPYLFDHAGLQQATSRMQA